MPIIGVAVAIVATMAITAVVSIGVNMLMGALFPKSRPQQQQQPSQPLPPNGTVNEVQSIPPLRAIGGRVRTSGDIAALEEKDGTLDQIIVHAAHRVHAYVQHWLHDELITIEENSQVSSPGHFDRKINLTVDLGRAVAVAWDQMVTRFPSIWTVDHRGDGLSKVLVSFHATNAEDFSKVYPQGRPAHSCLIDGALLYDPRQPGHDIDDNWADPETWTFSRNLALLRMWHLTHPAGCRLSLHDLYMPDWIVAADVCDETVIDRDGVEQPRYWGGVTWKYRGEGQDAVTVGRKIDQAAELVVYERPDGLIGVHAGRLVAPTIRITDDVLLSLRVDVNQSLGSTVLAVRGRFTDPRNDWMPGDAAIFGDPYGGGDTSQRTDTVENDFVEAHNHIQRLQKLRFIRANAARVSGQVHYTEETAELPSQRWICLHKPERGLDEATIEILSTRLSLTDLTIAFEGIVVPATLYDFDAATEEGIPGGIVGSIEAAGVPVPTGFTVARLSDGAGYYGQATWTYVNDTFHYELQYQLEDATDPRRSVFSNPGDTVLRTPPITDAAYRYRLRTWSVGAPSDWTAWFAPGTGGGSEGDTTPTADPSGLFANYGGGTDNYGVSWTNPSDANFHHTELYRATSDTAPFSEAVLVYTHYGAPGSTGTYSEVIGYAGGDLGVASVSYWVRSYNGSGVPSALVGPATAAKGV